MKFFYLCDPKLIIFEKIYCEQDQSINTDSDSSSGSDSDQDQQKKNIEFHIEFLQRFDIQYAMFQFIVFNEEDFLELDISDDDQERVQSSKQMRKKRKNTQSNSSSDDSD